jgi:hypothetical protein
MKALLCLALLTALITASLAPLIGIFIAVF